MTIRIVIADDHGILRAALRALLSAEPDLQVIAEAADGNQAIIIAQELRPDVLVADVSMPGPGGIEVARTLREAKSATRVLILSVYEDWQLVREALEAGAKGYVPKRAAETNLVAAVRIVVGGETFVPPEARSAGAGQMRPTTATGQLSAEETSLLRLLAQGRTQDQIGLALGMSRDQVAHLHSRLTEKLGLNGSRISFVRYAQDHGIPT